MFGDFHSYCAKYYYYSYVYVLNDILLHYTIIYSTIEYCISACMLVQYVCAWLIQCSLSSTSFLYIIVEFNLCVVDHNNTEAHSMYYSYFM